MGEKWTKDQLDAINTTDKAVIVSAAAGSGKTAVLVERTIRLLCDESKHISADRLLAVTFTNDAASQMREKLWNAINEKIEQEPQNEWLQLQQAKLQMARISTINSFCYDLVKNNIDSFDITSGVRILDDTESKTLLTKSLDNVMENNYLQRPEMMRKLNDMFCDERDSNLCEIVKQLYCFSRSLPFRDRWFQNVINSFDTDSEMYKQWVDNIFNNAYEKVMYAFNLVNDAYAVSQKLNYYSKVKKTIENDIVQVKAIRSVLKSNDIDKFKSFVNGFKWGRMTLKPDNGAPSSCDIEKASVEYIKKLRDDYKEKVNEIFELFIYTKEQIDSDLQLSRSAFESLVMIVNDLWDETWSMKTERNAIDFSDVEILSIRLLARETENGYERTQLADDIVNGKLYDIIMIDEFQDVNNLQDIIFKLISSGDNTDIIGKNLFVVGDVKQSIYRFRQANPKIFINTQDQAQSNDNIDIIKEIKLKKNFRSRKNVIDFVNFVFHSVMSSSIGEVTYNKDEELDFAAGYSKSDIPTEILVFEDKSNKDEYTLVAEKIRNMIDKKVPVSENGLQRPCRQSDFCILLRNRTQSKQFVDALNNSGLSSLNEELDGYLRSREISVLINMLTVLDNPMNDISLVAVMLSPLFNFSDDELLEIRASRKEAKLYLAVKDYVENKENKFDNSLVEKCRKFVDDIKKLRFYASGYSLEKLIRKIYVSTDFYSLASAFNDSEQKKANLRLLLEYANSYDKGIGGGLSGFIRYINTIFKNGDDFKQAGITTNSDNSVVIKTIHKSKGLEFPFVFLCGTSTKFTMMKKDLSKQMLINQYDGVGFRFKRRDTLEKFRTLAYDSIQITNTREMLSEEVRLLYVALTRAKERIIITYPVKQSNAQRYSDMARQIAKAGCVMPYISASADSMQDWLTMALFMYDGDNYLRKKYANSVLMPCVNMNSEIRFIDKADASTDKVKESDKIVLPDFEYDDETVNGIKRYMQFQYQDIYSQTASKLTVSEIAKKGNSIDFFYQIPKLSEDTGKLSPAEKGTATHRFMEVADYTEAERNVADEIVRLVSLGLITEKQANGIDISVLDNFFKSEFYMRMKSSKCIMREKQFLVMIKDLDIDNDDFSVYADTDGMLQGIADCIFEENDGYVLVDYKTDNVRTVDELTDHYSMQLMLYKVAFDLILDKPVKSSYIFSFKLGKGIELRF